MRKFWVVVAREYLERVRSRWFLFATIAGPLVFGGIGMAQVAFTQRAQVSTDLSDIIVLDATRVGLGDHVAEVLSGGIAGDSSLTEVHVIAPDTVARAEREALARVEHHDRAGYLLVDDSTMAGYRARYRGRNASSLPDVDQLTAAVRDAVLTTRLEQEGLNPEHIRQLTRVPLRVRADVVTDQGIGSSGLSSAILGYIVAFVFYLMIVIYGQAVLRGVMDEKTNRVAEVVLASVSSDALLAGKVVGVGSVALTQEVVWMSASAALFHWRAPLLQGLGYQNMVISFPTVSMGSAILLLLYFVMGFFFYAALFAAVGAAVSNPDDAQQASLPVMLLLVSTVALVVPVLLRPTGTLAQVGSCIPFSAPILMPLRLAVTQVPWFEITISLLILAASCGLAVWFASRVYRVGLLMYGKRPTIRELLRWVRAP